MDLRQHEDLQAREALELMASFGSMELSAVVLRQMEKQCLPDLRVERALIEPVEDRRIRGAGGNEIPIGLYRPHVSDRSGEPPPVLLYFHGGGRAGTASRRRNGHGYLVTIEMRDWF